MSDALYGYAVVPAGTPVPAVDAILPGSPILAITEGAVAVLASPVPRAWFAEGPENRMADPAWIAARAASHHGVVAALGTRALPLAFGALFSDTAPLAGWIAPRAERLAAALSAVAGSAEWSVSLGADEAAQAAHLAGTDAALRALDSALAAATPGTAFLLSRRREKALAAAQLAQRQAAATDLAARLTALARAVLPATPRPPALAAWSLLVRDADAAALRAALESEAEQLEAAGLTLSLSGPWPAYAFARQVLADA